MSSSSSSNSPCAACKIQRRKCTQECVFAPYFPPDNPQRFAYVHKVFGASNVAKLLNELSAAQREDAVKSLAYEAEARLRDPVYGCVGLISVLQHRLKQLQTELNHAKKELATYIGPQAMMPILQPPPHPPHAPFSVFGFNNGMPPSPPPPPHITGLVPPQGGRQLVIRDPHHHQHQVFDPHREMTPPQELLRFNDTGGGGGCGGGGYEVVPSASESGFNQMSAADAISPSLALGPADHSYHQMEPQRTEPHHHSLHHQLQTHLMLSPQSLQPQQSPLSHKQLTCESQDRRSSTAPSF